MIQRFFKLFISILIYCIDQFEILLREIFGKKVPPKHIIIYYHAVRQQQRARFAKQLDEILRLSKPFSLDTKYPNLDETYYVAITFDDGFVSFYQNALPELIKRNVPFTVFVPTGYLGQFPDWIKTKPHQFDSEKIMNREQLRELMKFNVAQIGSHCVSHRDLTVLTEDEARNEIFQSKSDLEKILDKKVTTLSFPHGGFNQTIIEHAKRAGYERVFSIIPTISFANTAEYVTGRIKVDPDDWLLEFRLKFLGAYRWLPKGFFIKGQIKKVFGLH